MGSVVVFIFFKSVLVLSLAMSAYYINIKNYSGNYKYQFWRVASYPLIVYTLVEGLRYGRAVDYLYYKSISVNPFHYELVNVEPLFLSFNKVLYFFGIPYPFAFMFYSFLLIGSCFIIIKQNRKVATWAIPLCYLATIEQSENLVRQFAAFSFLLIAIKYLLDGEGKKLSFPILCKFAFFVTCAFFTHYSSIIVVPFILWFKLAENPFRNIYIILGLYVGSSLWSPSPDALVNYFHYLKVFNLYSGYLETTDRWLVGEGVDSTTIMQGPAYLIRYYTFPALILFYGYKILDKYRTSNLSLFYHLFFIGVLARGTAAVAATEMIGRLILFFHMFYFIVLAYILYDMAITYKFLTPLKRMVFYYLIIDCSYLIIKTIWSYNIENGVRFIWDIA